MLIFTLGVIEMFIVTYWTKAVVESRIYMSGAVTVINVLIWFYVLRTFVDDINNWYIVLSYALGCAVGTMLSGLVSNREKARKSKKVKQALALKHSQENVRAVIKDDLAKLEEQSLVTE